MNSNLIELYQKRLEGLGKIVDSLHEIIGNDQALRLMDTPELLKYRIDRVNQLVRDTLTSQKEHIIIHLLNKCDHVIAQPTGLTRQIDLLRVKVKELSQEISFYKSEAELLKVQLTVERQGSCSYKFQLQQLRNELCQREELIKRNYEIISQHEIEKQLKCNQMKQRQEIFRGKEDIQRRSLDKIMKLQTQVREVKLLAEKRSLQVEQIKNKLQISLVEQKGKQQPIRARMERVQTLKKEMAKLFQQLQHNRQTIIVLKHNIHSILKQPLEELSKQCIILKRQLKNGLFQFVNETFAKMYSEVSKSSRIPDDKRGQDGKESLLIRMSKLQAEMGTFIDTQVRL